MNGGPSWKWIAGILVTVLVLVASAAFTGIETRLQALEHAQSQFRDDVIQRLTRIETKLQVIETMERPTVRTNPHPTRPCC